MYYTNKSGAKVLAAFFLVFTITFSACKSSRVESAKLHIKKKDVVSAEALLREELEESPDNATALFWIGKLHYLRKKYADAAFAFQKAKEIKKDLTNSELGEIDEVLVNLKAASLYEGITEYNKMANLVNSNKYAKVSKELEKARILLNAHLSGSKGSQPSPDAIEALKNIALVKKDPEFLEDMLRLKTPGPTTSKNGASSKKDYVNLAYMYLEKGDAKKALSILTEKTSGQKDKTLEVGLAFVYAYIKENKIQDALNELKILALENPKNKYVLFSLAYCHQKKEAFEDALVNYKLCLSIDGAFKEAAFNFAVCAYQISSGLKKEDVANKQNQLGQAISVLEKVANEANDKSYWDLLALLYRELGKEKKAEEATRKALSLSKK